MQDLSAIGDDGRTQAEREELEHYALQLTLYSMAPKRRKKASRRPASDRLPPALLVAASGRMVEMTTDEYDAYRAEAQQIMRWKAQLSVDPAAVPSRRGLLRMLQNRARSAPSTAAGFGCVGQKAKTWAAMTGIVRR